MTDDEEAQQPPHLPEQLYGPTAGTLLFRQARFGLINGDFIVMQNCSNPYFFSALLNHAESGYDFSLLPAIKVVYNSNTAGEALKQRASFVADRLTEIARNPDGFIAGEGGKYIADRDLFNAYLRLAGERRSRTIEILRLLHSNNTEARRTALFIIGRMRMKDMTGEVCNFLEVRGLEYEAETVLKNFGRNAVKPLLNKFLFSSGREPLKIQIIRLMASNITDLTAEFLVDCLISGSLMVKELASSLLAHTGFMANEDQKQKLLKLHSRLSVILRENTKALYFAGESGCTDLCMALDEEIMVIRRIASCIVKIISGSGEGSRISEANEPVKFAPGKVRFSSRPAPLNRIAEKIINRDYTLTGLWLKGCAVRVVDSGDDTQLNESLVALFFNPEAILREEAALASRRTGSGIFRQTAGRVPAEYSERLRLIDSGTLPEEDMLFSKVNFLSAIFEKIPRQALLRLSETLKFFPGNFSADEPGLSWPLGSQGDGGEVFMIYGAEKNSGRSLTGVNGFYFLPLQGVEEYGIMYPGYAMIIYDFISSIEKRAVNRIE